MTVPEESIEVAEDPRVRVSQRRRRIAGFLGLLIFVGAIFHRPLLRACALPLIASDGPQEAEILVVLGGGDGGRVRHAVELWRQGCSSSGKIIMAGGPLYQKLTWARVMADYAQELGVPADALLLEEDSLTTRSDAERSFAMLKERGFKDILIVTDAFHSRRARREFQRLASEGERVRCAAVPRESEDWWKSDSETRFLVSEYLKWLWPR